MYLFWVKYRNRILLEEKRGIAWSLAALWKLEGVRDTLINLEEDDIKHVLLDCLATINWRMKFLNKSGLM